MGEWEYFTNQNQWKSYLKNLVRTNNKALLKSVLCIYENQTDEEKEMGESVEDNNIGFSKWDAEEMSDIARKLKLGKKLSLNELVHARLVMPKYWKQLMVISKRKMEAKRQKEQEEYEELIESLNAKEQTELELFREHNEIIRQCSEEGIPCRYGICDECPLVTGIQMRLSV